MTRVVIHGHLPLVTVLVDAVMTSLLTAAAESEEKYAAETTTRVTLVSFPYCAMWPCSLFCDEITLIGQSGSQAFLQDSVESFHFRVTLRRVQR